MKKSPFFAGLLLGSALLAGDVSLLDGHLVVSLPNGATRVQRTTGIIEEGPAESETLIRCGAGDKRMELYAKELGIMASRRYPTSELRAMKELNAAGPYFEFGSLPGDIVYALLRQPPTEAELTDANLYAVANIRHPDGTQQRLRFLFGRKKAQRAEECRAAVLEALKTLRPADGGRQTEARTELLTCPVRGVVLLLPIPQGHLSFHHQEGETVVHLFKPLSADGKDSPAELCLQIGTQPELFYDQQKEDIDPRTHSTQRGTILGQAVQWRIFAQEGNGNFMAECLLPLGSTEKKADFLPGTAEKGVYIQFSALATDVASLRRMITLAGQLQLLPEKEAPASRARIPTNTERNP